MTVDLCGSGGSGPQLGFQPLYTVCPQRQGLLHIDAGKAVPAQQYNRFDRLFRALGLRKTAVILAFDTPVSPPYKRGSHGERGVPKTSRVLAAEGFATQMVRSPARGLDRPVVCSMHRMFGKGYAGGGERQCLDLRVERRCFRRR